ncbi:hydroxyacylglutathione hydrolase [Sphingomonas sp. KR1UV-12]|uniref:Hydroxyacylglutathione hydrolase n=1 Tax=Sphingomonas aurea TaxID=3063994 RepID=A0ABT9EFJ7_9SPHN|nr:hydroxyacylglutathione hydrolase [Sphingomonas sp. KR1UV-12]MDP1025740.1 hydroxyacylglutathione hydrolase [Sphingomonas sp. KR1UV-12]
MAAPPLQVVAVPVLADNYAWLVYDPHTQEAVVVDPGEAGPVQAAADARGWTIAQVWTTHWHPDHTGGNAAMKAAGATILGPEAERAKIDPMDVGLSEGDVVRIGSHTGQVMAVPGHTAGHIALHFADDALLFTGDTLFAMGCGRLFEGTPAEMWANMERFAAMPDETKVYGGHEYTQSNARFAAHTDPDNRDIAARREEVDALRARGEPTLPTTIGQERATNPFLRAGSAARLGELRAAKDAFRG